MTQPDRYSRQVLFRPIGSAGQEALSAARVLVVGCGAIGSHSAEILARAGVGRLRLVDRDIVEWSNLQRQMGYTEEDARLGLPKAPALAAHIARINSSVSVEAHAIELHAQNAPVLAADVDVIADGTDNVSTRFLLNDVSFRLGVPWVYAGVIEARARVQAFSGRKGPCLRCVIDSPPPPGTLATCDTAGVIGPAAALAAAWQAALVMRTIVDGGAENVAGKEVELRPWDAGAKVVNVAADPACPLCASGRCEFLDAPPDDAVVRLCGRTAVQVRPRPSSSPPVDLDTLAGRLERLAPVVRRPGCLRLEVDGATVTVFADLRATFDGLTDAARARSLYARFIGK